MGGREGTRVGRDNTMEIRIRKEWEIRIGKECEKDICCMKRFEDKKLKVE